MNFKFQSPFKNIQYGIIFKKVKLSQIYSIIVKSYYAFKYQFRKVFKMRKPRKPIFPGKGGERSH